MKLRYAAALAIVGIVLAVAIVLSALMPRYFLIVAFPENPVVQIGPFVTYAGCERARQQVAEIEVAGQPLTKEGMDKLTGIMGCLSSR